MSYETFQKIWVEPDGRMMCRYKCSNVWPQTWDTGEYAPRCKTLEEKVRAVFESAIDGCVRLQSSCGRYYTILQDLEAKEREIREAIKDLPDIDWMYSSGTYYKRRDFLAQYGADLYLKQPTQDWPTFRESHIQEYFFLCDQKKKEYEEEDKVAIKTASYSPLYSDSKYDVVIDFEDNLYFCSKEQYSTRGVLKEASKAIKFDQKYLSMLFYVLAGNYRDKTYDEVVSYGRTALERGARAAQLDAIQDLLNSVNLPPYDTLPWLDFKVAKVA